MLVERFEERGLSHYSYAVGCREKGQIAIIDPRFDVEIYLEYAEKNGLVISHVFETHIHADYASGARYLAMRARATLMLSGHDKGEKYEVQFPHKECLDGDRIKLGSILLEVLHTPGHTPEHISFLAYEKGEPKALFSGDFLIYGSFGRPDLLGEETARPLAKKLYQSIKTKLYPLPNTIQIYPAHGAGSFCAAGVRDQSFSTLGQERLKNPYLRPNMSEKECVECALLHPIPCPDYFFRMKAYNVSGERNKVSFPHPMDVGEYQKCMVRGHVIIDLRDQKSFSGGHIPGAICIGAGAKVGFWASWVVPYDTPLLLVTDDPTHIQEAVNALARVGLSQVQGYLKGGMESWKQAQLPLQKIGEMSPHEVEKKRSECQVIDVRSMEEWMMGHIVGAKHLPCLDLPQRINELPKSPLVFVCAGGYRSILAASLAKRRGYEAIAHIPGGVHAWQATGHSLVSD